ncbi:MAG: hypothetical protein ACP5T9_05320 [Thermoplasmata archaeon]
MKSRKTDVKVLRKDVYVVVDVTNFCDCPSPGGVSGEIFGIFERMEDAQRHIDFLRKKCEGIPPEKRVCEFLILKFKLNEGVKRIPTY